MSIFISGFEEPCQNYYRLPNAWLDQLASIRKTYRNRSLAPIKVLEYILKHTWGWQRFESGVILSLDELQNGKRWGHRRSDSGTGLSINAIRKSLASLEDLGYIEKLGFNCYRPKLKPATSEYFKLPKMWTDITAQVRSSLTVLITEYLMRHTWGFQNPQGVWMDVDELQNGRSYADGRRYDAGVGGDIKSIRAALEEAVALGLVVWTDRCETSRLYNLHLAGMKTGTDGEYLGELPWETQAETQDNGTTVIETINNEEETPWEKPLGEVLAEEINLPDLLTGLGIYGPARAELTARNIPVEQIVAWALYVSGIDNLANPAGLLVKLLRSGEAAPVPFVDLVRLQLGSWIEILAQTGPLAQNEYLPHADVRLWEAVMGPKGKNRLPGWLAAYVDSKSQRYFDFETPIADTIDTLEAAEEEPVQTFLQTVTEEAAPEMEPVNTWKEAVNIPAGADDRVLKDTVKTHFQNTENKQTRPAQAIVIWKNPKSNLHFSLTQNPAERCLIHRLTLQPHCWQSSTLDWGDNKFCFLLSGVIQIRLDLYKANGSFDPPDSDQTK